MLPATSFYLRVNHDDARERRPARALVDARRAVADGAGAMDAWGAVGADGERASAGVRHLGAM